MRAGRARRFYVAANRGEVLMSSSELQGDPTRADIVEASRPAIVAASRELENFSADVLEAIAGDTGSIPKSEYTDALVMSMLCAEIRRLRVRVERLERGQGIA
jgi:hypothetical protein